MFSHNDLKKYSSTTTSPCGDCVEHTAMRTYPDASAIVISSTPCQGVTCFVVATVNDVYK